ncbi:uncharacterized protein I206_104928 [Kwoniella pini CBS 10737]|uniref:Uncharacterized protein n=1 Tax=Kwoniella pini CBS 10737 TaxID=1296096 RepID=A0A1B9I8B6_9TREE|nr:uncharacterized protein I206_02469 [Kwoniella pini CBS 10737]OCF51753.1 hypothetical protein I206_02469 [Kwoniella pini CBS 10737]
MAPPMNADAKRLRTIIVSFPILVVTTAILYRRTMLGEEQRKIPRDITDLATAQERIGQVGGVPWEVQGMEHEARGTR